MKIETLVLLLKGSSFIGAAVFVNLSTNLAQWANSGEWPAKISWTVIVCGALGAGCNALLSFLSGSYADYIASKKANGGTEIFKRTPQPNTETKTQP